MQVTELVSRVEKFRKDLDEHFALWGQSLDDTLPEYPIRNCETLRRQYDRLARQLGALRPYFERLALPTVMGNAYGQWDAFYSAVSNDVAVRKGSSIEAVLSQLQQALGKLESMNPLSEFELQQGATVPMRSPQQVTNIYNLQGTQSRVNIQSSDHSTNVSSVTEQQLFSQIRNDLKKSLTDKSELENILRKVNELEAAQHEGDFLLKYQEFIGVVANHMNIVAPFIPALAQMLR